MKKISLLFFLLGFGGLAAQKPASKTNSVVTELNLAPFLKRTEFKVGYVGNFIWNPGLSAGAEYLWKEKVRTKEKKRGTKIITKQWLLNGTVGMSWDPRSEFGIFTNYGITWRRTNAKGKQINIQFNPLGYYRSFLGETYEVSGDNVDKVFLGGTNYFAPSISYGIGKFRKGKKLSGKYINVTYMFRMPHNTSYLPVYFVEIGHRFKFKRKK